MTHGTFTGLLTAWLLAALAPLAHAAETVDVQEAETNTDDAQAAADPVDPAELAEAAQDVFYLADSGVVVLRFSVFVDGKPYRTSWQEFLDTRFKQLDGNGDGALDDKERRGLPARELLQNFGLLNPASNSAAGIEPDFRPRDGKVTRQELADWFARIGFEPFRVRIEPPQNQNRLTFSGAMRPQADAPKVLLEKLDTDGNEKISAEEFRAAPHALRKLDLDRDQSIGMTELTTTQNIYAAVRSVNGRQPAEEPRFLALDGVDSRRALMQHLLNRYDRATPGSGGAAKDNRLSREELGFTADDFAALDADGDGKLDFEETLQFLGNPQPQREVLVRLGGRKKGQPAFEFGPKTEGQLAGGLASLVVAGVQLELAVNEFGYWNLRSGLESIFKNADADGTGYVDDKEGPRMGLASERFKLIDADNDGKLFQQEWLDVVMPLQELDRRRLELHVADRGRDLFRILDLNADTRIGPREFRAAVERMPLWDSSGDKLVEVTEIPQQYRLVVGRGSLNVLGRVVVERAGSPRYANSGSPASAGPPWFAKMDRNSDGDVSQLEFLGPPETFRQHDADHDGLLDAQEALALGSE